MNSKNNVFGNMAVEGIENFEELLKEQRKAIVERDIPLLESSTLTMIERLYQRGLYGQIIVAAYPAADALKLFSSIKKNSFVEYATESLLRVLGGDLDDEAETLTSDMIVSVVKHIVSVLFTYDFERFCRLIEDIEKIFLENQENKRLRNNEIIKKIVKAINDEEHEDEKVVKYAISVSEVWRTKYNEIMKKIHDTVGVAYESIGRMEHASILDGYAPFGDDTAEIVQDYAYIAECVRSNTPFPKEMLFKWLDKYNSSPDTFKDIMACQLLWGLIAYGIQHQWFAAESMRDVIAALYKNVTSGMCDTPEYKLNPIGVYRAQLYMILGEASVLIYTYQEDLERCFEFAMEALRYANDAWLQYALCYDEDFGNHLKELEYVFQQTIGMILMLLDREKYKEPENDLADKIEKFFSALYRRKNIDFYSEFWRAHNTSVAEKEAVLHFSPTVEEIKATLSDDSIVIDFESVLINISSEDPVEVLSNKSNYALVAFAISKGNPVKMHAANYKGEQTVAELVKDALEPHNGQNGNIIVCPNSFCNNISFAALPCGSEKETYLIDGYTTRNIVNVYDVVHPRSKETYKDNLVIYPVEFSEDGLKPLPSSQLECERILELFKVASVRKRLNAVRLSQSNATKANVVESLKNGNYDILHISTHGRVEEGKVFMRLAGKDNDQHIWLNEDELAEYAKKTNLAVFSLCWGGKMNDEALSSISGFVRSMMLAGTTSVIAPLDEVDDVATCELFRIFYDKYLDEKNSDRPLEEIWQEAILDFKTPHWVGENYYNYKNPKYWAPWVLYSV